MSFLMFQLHFITPSSGCICRIPRLKRDPPGPGEGEGWRGGRGRILVPPFIPLHSCPSSSAQLSHRRSAWNLAHSCSLRRREGEEEGKEEEQEKEEGARKERGSSWCAPVSTVGVLSEGEGSRAVVTAAGELDPGCSRSHQVGGDEMTARGLEHWRISWGVTGQAMLVDS